MDPFQKHLHQDFNERLNSIMRELKTNYIQLLKCMKFQNQKDRIAQQKLKKLQKKKNRLNQQYDNQNDSIPQIKEDVLYSFNEELSKQNRLQISLLKLLQGLNKLAEFNVELKEYAVINIEQSEVDLGDPKQTLDKIIGMFKKQ